MREFVKLFIRRLHNDFFIGKAGRFWSNGGRMPFRVDLRRASARPVKTDKNPYDSRRNVEETTTPSRNEVPGAVSGLSHLEAPESLDDAVRLAKASGIIADIKQVERERQTLADVPFGSHAVRRPGESVRECLDRFWAGASD